MDAPFITSVSVLFFIEHAMHDKPSFAGRIVLALILMVCFYALALALAGTLICLPIGMVVFANRIPLKLAILSLIGGCMILWSVMPRWDRFIAPGPRLTEKDQPELFRQLQSVAQSTEQTMPAEVYALPEMNAWVANRGGIMGIGSRRIMGIGIPLMQVLSSQQLRGVLAHEFGHYHGGDTKLGPWLYVTRSAIVRTVMNLASSGSSILYLPFEWYLKLFLRLTQKVSRQQEFTADALAAKIVGPQAIGEALKVVHSKALAFDGYWQNEYSPALERGYRPPMAQGFREYSNAPLIKEAVEETLKQAMEESKSDIYDSHPALKERLSAINLVNGPRSLANDPPAIDWIRDVDGLEKQMIDHMAKTLKVSAPQAIGWTETVERVLVPNYFQMIHDLGGNLKGLTLEQAAQKLSTAEKCGELISATVLPHIPDGETKRSLASQIVGTLSILALYLRGWAVQNPMGQAPFVRNAQDDRIEPFEWIKEFSEQKCSLDDLIAKYREYQIDSFPIDEILNHKINSDAK